MELRKCVVLRWLDSRGLGEPMAIEVFHASPVLHLAFFRNVAVSHTRGLLRLADMQRIGDAYRTLQRRHPNGIATFVVICPGTPVAEREALAESSRFMAELRGAIVSTAVVIEDNGVMAQMLTTVIRGINVMTRHKALVVFANQDDALRATAPHAIKQSAGEETTALLKQAIAEAREGWQRGAQ